MKDLKINSVITSTLNKISITVNGQKFDFDVTVNDGKVESVVRTSNTQQAIDWDTWKAVNDLIRKVFERS
jgi:acid stress-induced BolA-like protein IbaG/YrbA